MQKHSLRIVPLGGLGEIGKNMTVVEWGDDAILIDSGIMFPENDMLGVDYIIPDFSYLREKEDLRLHGILYTHGHEDHTGAIAHVIEAFPGTPVWATPLTAALLKVKLKDARQQDHCEVNIFQPGADFQVGPFPIESFRVCHSIPDCVGFGINTPLGLIVHTGDYKFDNTPPDGHRPDYAKLADFSRRGVLLLLADSTNADRPGWTPSESTVVAAFDEVFEEARGRIMIATFASHLQRIQQVADCARQHGRRMAIAGYSMNANVRMARAMGILKLDEDILVELSASNDLPSENVVIMVTGTQGEPSAVLGRLAQGRHHQLDVRPDDTIVVSAHAIPGNEEMVYRTINRLFQRGANVLYDPVAPVHVSGHACQEEMKLMLNLTQPRYFVPVHGELRHLMAHARLALASGLPEKNIRVVENGSVVSIDEEGIQIGERVPGGYVFVDGSGVGDVGPAVMRDRETLGKDGFLVVVANLDADSGELVAEPEILTRGFVYHREADDLIENIRKTARASLADTAASQNGRRRNILQERISRMLYSETRRRPMVFSIINEHQAAASAPSPG
ncbi:MAG: ribonuclease J [Anaerolineaceae bacterium]|nr:ribonuclease J [Anaerolineaceae bacterium]